MPVVVSQDQSADAQRLGGRSHGRQGDHWRELLPERFSDEMITEEERVIAQLFGPPRGP